MFAQVYRRNYHNDEEIGKEKNFNYYIRAKKMIYCWIPLLLTMSSAYALVDYTGYAVISALAKTTEEVEFLMNLEDYMDDELDFLRSPAHGQTADIMVAPDSAAKAKQVLDDAGIEYHVSTLDMQRHIDIEKRSMCDEETLIPRNITNNYLRYDEIVAFVYGIKADYPDRVRVRRFGKSYEGRDLLEVRISSDLFNRKPAIWLEFSAHAREWISQSTGLNLIQTLASHTQDGESMLVKYDWYIVPVLNPDGYEYTHTDDRMWRKNRQRYGRCCVGIDLNRNWGINFGGEGSSDNCQSSIFHGNKTFSAPETRALKRAIERTPNVTAFISIHSYGQEIISPYLYTDTLPLDHEELTAIGVSIRDAIEAIRGTNFTVGRDYEYDYSGTAVDYWYDKGIKYSYLFELPPEFFSQGHFMAPTSEIYPVAMETIAGLKAFADLDLGI